LAKRYIVEETVDIPESIDVSVEGRQVSVTGPLGKLERDFSHAPVTIHLGDGKVSVEVRWPDKMQAAMVGTVRSHVRNMIRGVQKGFTFKLKVVFAHFPVNVKVEGNRVVIENFGGERRPRVVDFGEGVRVSIEGEDVVVKGIDLEKVSQTASEIEQATHIKKKDPRVFLDGIYVYERQEGM